MLAKVIDNHRWKSIVALGGRTYSKTEWRDVPPGREAEARRHPHLDIKEAEADGPNKGETFSDEAEEDVVEADAIEGPDPIETLRQQAKEAKIPGWNLMKEETLRQRLAELDD